MPDNQIPATQPDSGANPTELNFDGPQAENPRIKRRSLKAKPAGLIKPSGNAVSAARDLEREAPPLSTQPTAKPQVPAPAQAKSIPVVVKASETPTAPPRTTPFSSTASAQSTTTAAKPAAPSTAGAAASPHGTRPATLYYSSSQPRKDKEASSPMKTTPPASTASTASASSSTTQPSSATRPAATASAQPSTAARTTTAAAPTRPSPNIDYRANVDRQTREQKSVGSILAYVVYGFIALFVITAILAGYGADVIFKQLHDESATVADLDQHYAAANADLTTKLAATQDSLNQSQSQITRQQDVIIKQQEELNHLITMLNDDSNMLKLEKQTRAQETASLRARVKDLENHNTSFNH